MFDRLEFKFLCYVEKLFMYLNFIYLMRIYMILVVYCDIECMERIWCIVV